MGFGKWSFLLFRRFSDFSLRRYSDPPQNFGDFPTYCQYYEKSSVFYIRRFSDMCFRRYSDPKFRRFSASPFIYYMIVTFLGLNPCLKTCSNTTKKCCRGMKSESSWRPKLMLDSRTSRITSFMIRYYYILTLKHITSCTMWSTFFQRHKWPQTKMHTNSNIIFGHSFSCSFTWWDPFCSEC